MTNNFIFVCAYYQLVFHLLEIFLYIRFLVLVLFLLVNKNVSQRKGINSSYM